MSTRREITRAATVTEIKETALRLMHEQSSTDLRFSDIAREMSMTPPALYRYFSGRDELLTALLADAYEDLADRLEKALADLGGGTRAAAFSCVADTYRRWALADPLRFALVFGLPVAGYTAPADGPHCEAGARALGSLAAAVTGSSVASPFEPPVELALLHSWAAIHGFVSLEAFGHLDAKAAGHTDDAYRSLLAGVITYLGIADPA